MILKIDTTERGQISVELIDKEKIIGSVVKNQEKGSQVLLPSIIQVLRDHKKKLQDLTSIKVNPGPGSFTGTRVGVSVANALSYALDIPLNGKKGKIVEPIYEKSKFD